MEAVQKINNTLYISKYRPVSLKSTILLPRLRTYLTGDDDNSIKLENNILMVGRPGMGKTTIAKIIENNFDTMKINASKDMNMEALRTDVTDFCRTMDIMSDTPREKVVYLDEFDGVKPAVQDALRAFIEDYEIYVKFIATCNDISSISAGMLSRFTILDFEPESMEETNFLKNKYGARLKNIADKEDIKISNEEILSIINKQFPDLRSMTSELQYIKKVGIPLTNKAYIDEELYNLIISPKDTAITYEIILTKYSTNIQSLLGSLGRNFAMWIFEKYPQKGTAVAKAIPIVVKYSNMLRTCIDPVVLACALIYELQNTFKN